MSCIRRALITVGGTVAVLAVLGIVLAGKGSAFTAALDSAPVWALVLATALQLGALVVRTEAWHVCVGAAGGTVGRRRLYRASSVGYVVALVNGQLGVATRIGVLRRANPHTCPRLPTLVGAELPIVVTEAALAAVWCFTLVGPLGLPWWLPIAGFALMALVTIGLCRLARRPRNGFVRGLAVLRSLDGRGRVVALVLVAVLAQIARNWLVLRVTGTPVSLFDSIAVLIAIVAISVLPLGPGVGAAATVMILGHHGVAAVAAAGVLLTATGLAGALCFAAWALVDRVVVTRRGRGPRSVPVLPALAPVPAAPLVPPAPLPVPTA